MEKLEFVDEIKEANIINEAKENGKKYWIYNGFKVPENFGWWIVLMELSKLKNVELEIVYSRNLIKKRPEVFTIDEKNCIAPEMPLLVNVYKIKKERVKHDFEELFGKTYRKKKEKVIVLRNLEGLDPNPLESLNMLKAIL